jgi:hypothetical protein
MDAPKTILRRKCRYFSCGWEAGTERRRRPLPNQGPTKTRKGTPRTRIKYAYFVLKRIWTCTSSWHFIFALKFSPWDEKTAKRPQFHPQERSRACKEGFFQWNRCKAWFHTVNDVLERIIMASEVAQWLSAFTCPVQPTACICAKSRGKGHSIALKSSRSSRSHIFDVSLTRSLSACPIWKVRGGLVISSWNVMVGMKIQYAFSGIHFRSLTFRAVARADEVQRLLEDW